MRWIETKGPYILLGILFLWIFIFAIYNSYFDKGWQLILVGTFLITVLLTILVIVIKKTKKPKTQANVKEFEKSLKGGLFHFKCPTCKGIFALKKSKSNDEKPVKMTCPDCGIVGIISPKPKSCIEEIPEKKSVKASFKCTSCGEGITIWAEGSELYNDLHIFSCPFCGKDERLKRF
ncbi:hypothetical protein [Romboutsia sp.]|uniref:hypothetical protein n=1 Tax=Romboutsia sp. TaxID=1965302 RepID=UPI002C9E9096|nr:hypothetical protein [Romboutsia sp.]HSQ88219.1 hypothetical protein [Romboutsia sp.]